MTPEQEELLLVVAKLFRRSLNDKIQELANNKPTKENHQYCLDAEFYELAQAMAPFDAIAAQYIFAVDKPQSVNETLN